MRLVMEARAPITENFVSMVETGDFIEKAGMWREERTVVEKLEGTDTEE